LNNEPPRTPAASPPEEKAMPQTTVYRPTPTNPTTPTEPKIREAAIEDLDDFMDEVDNLLDQEEAFAVNYRQRGGQ
jgi:hypothetical protein